MTIVWILIFIVSIAALVKSADWFVVSSEKIGMAFKISPFIVGVTIVAIGTSLPELASSIAAVLRGETTIVAANAVGSNVANILLIIGLSAIVARILIVRRSLIDLDAPLLGVVTALFIFIMWDGKIVFWEGILLILAFLVYLLYAIFRRKESEIETFEIPEILPSREERRKMEELRRLKAAKGLMEIKKEEERPAKLNYKVFLFLILGAIGLTVGANYTIESMIEISKIFDIAPSLIAITALAIGTSLPELVVSIQAAMKKKYEIAIGNVFGSNVFNVLLVVGIPALIRPLTVDELTLKIGLPFLVVATLLFIISGISRRIHAWEGAMYLLIYVLFIVKLYGLF